jgi:exodeoxyribonuclease VII large subunit
MSTSEQSDRRKVYQVTEINRLARLALENEFGDVWIEGELSEVKKWPSGHTYFSLKDGQSVLRAAFFKNDQRGLTFDLKNGDKIQAYGRLNIYEAKGSYQFIVRRAEPAGRGSLQEAFEQLKRKLAAEGLFDEKRKRPIPLLPQHVGIVTSPSGAAVRDILNVLTRRFPNLHVVVAPARVQGEGAAAEIAAGIRNLHALGGIDVMIVGRGGGSLEDLWAFNEEAVARAIAEATLPVISAVGHEVDFTIADFVADLRAPTPSAAAELVVGQKEAFEEALSSYTRRLGRSLLAATLQLRNRLTAAGKSYVFREPANMIRQYAQRIDGLCERLRVTPNRVVEQHRQSLRETTLRLGHQASAALATGKQNVRRLDGQLKALSPLATLKRGYSITRTAGGDVVRSTRQARAGTKLATMVADGTIASTVTDEQEE